MSMTYTTIAKPKHGSLEWLQSRWRDSEGKVLFGASDAPVLMGASKYRTRQDLFLDKLNQPQVQPDKPEFRRGNLIEPVLLQEAGEILKAPVFTPNVVYRQGRFSVSLDGVDNEENPSFIVEAKTTNHYQVRTSEDLPQEWLWQGWAQQLVLGVPVYFVVLDRDQAISLVEMPDNEPAKDALKLESEIFGEMVESGMPNEEELANFSAEGIAQLYPVVSPTAIELGDELSDLVQWLESARESRKHAEIVEQDAKDRIARLLQGNEVGLANGAKVVSWKQQAGKTSVDLAALRRDNPELVAQYERQGQPYRVMRTHK